MHKLTSTTSSACHLTKLSTCISGVPYNVPLNKIYFSISQFLKQKIEAFSFSSSIRGIQMNFSYIRIANVCKTWEKEKRTERISNNSRKYFFFFFCFFASFHFTFTNILKRIVISYKSISVQRFSWEEAFNVFWETKLKIKIGCWLYQSQLEKFLYHTCYFLSTSFCILHRFFFSPQD